MCIGAMKVDLERDSQVCIREVWAYNLDAELKLIREIVGQYPFVAMDTEFPGVVLRPPVGTTLKNRGEYNYETLKANVDALHLIQLGLTFSDVYGNLPDCGTGKPCVWQFNFKEFNPRRDIYAPDSIELLRKSGIDLEKNRRNGIRSQRFAELLMASGVVLNENVRWIAFHGAYDFGYLLKLLTCQKMPSTPHGFFRLMRLYFPKVYDVKHLIKFCDGLYGGLDRVAELLKVERIGISHQAGSDSLLTSYVFMKLKQGCLHTSTETFAGILYGL